MIKIEPKIIKLASKNLVGMKTSMSLVHNKTGILWQNFMPKRKQINHVITNDLYSMQIYDTDYFVHFTPQNTFTKWACVEVSSFENLPIDCESFNLQEGLYAVFHYKGLSSDTKIFEYIYSVWLPQSGYELDQRPHFELLGENYKNNDLNSEEDIFIPIRLKQ
ncbi:MAG TPA: GyrI-like domain-containing protein [Bacteroidia bacterium]|nr:GyrI-like domain-containing protein [Bacteroidia bacterium]